MKNIIYFLPFIFLISCGNKQVVFDEILKNELIKRRKLDQNIQFNKEISFSEKDKLIDSIFKTNCKWAKKIYNKNGFLGYDKVGKKGSNSFYLLVQHCDKDPKFQREVAKAMKREVKRENANEQYSVYLIDRYRKNLGLKQIYGTQMVYPNADRKPIPYPIKDSLKVDERRKSVGLEPLKEYIKSLIELNNSLSN